MITEDIINELDKFITKYKTLKSDNQNLNQFKADVKTALNSKGIINTSEDSEIINSVNTYTPPKGGTPLDADYLKKVGLLPDNFVGTPTEKDLTVNKFIVPHPYNDRILFVSNSSAYNRIKLELNGVTKQIAFTNQRSYLSDTTYLDKRKVSITNDGYWVWELDLKDKGTYKITSDYGNSIEKTFDYDPNIVKSMGDYLIYAVKISERKILCHDEGGVLMSEYLDKSRLSDDTKNNILVPLNNKLTKGGWISTGNSLGYVLNLRTGKAHKINFTRDSQADNAIRGENRKKYLSPIIYSDRLDIVAESSIYSLTIKGKSPQTFMMDIDYRDGDTLIFAFNRDIIEEIAHAYPEEAVAEYLKKVFKGMSEHTTLEAGE